MKSYQKADLKKFNAANLNKIAVEEFKLTVAENLTKGQIVTMILKAQEGGSIPAAANAPKPKKDVIVIPAKAVLGEEVKINTVGVGDVFRYKSSKKLYLCAAIMPKGEKEARLFYSATQSYMSTSTSETVIVVIKGEGKLTAAIAKKFDNLVKENFQSKKNIEYTKLYKEVQAELKAIAEAAAKATTSKPVAGPAKPAKVAPAAKPATNAAGNETKPLTAIEKAQIKAAAKKVTDAKLKAAAEAKKVVGHPAIDTNFIANNIQLGEEVSA